MSELITQEIIFQSSGAACEYASEAAPPEAQTASSEITWFIDRTPDYNYMNNIHNYANHYINNYINIEPTIRFEETKNIIVICQILEISDEEQNCCICMEMREKNEICSLNCNHKFCEICVENCVKRDGKYNCSLCRESVTIITTQKNDFQEKISEYII